MDIQILIKTDKTIADIYKQYQLPPNWSRPPGFVTLSKLILEQQVSLASARAHFIKLNSYLAEFTPTEILKLTDEEMRHCQISRQKAKYLRDLSMKIKSNHLDLENLSNESEAEIRKQLASIKGIGIWTTDVYLIFCLRAKDIFPVGDIAIVNTMKELTGAKTKRRNYLLRRKMETFTFSCDLFFMALLS